MADIYKPPYPWFGGKSQVAATVWRGLGDVRNYVEPFFGSGATLFLRPDDHAPYVETVNDFDGFVANFWRALQRDVEQVAHHADNPVNECDLHARHLWLVNQRESLTDRLCGDPDFYDAKAAGWWCWGLCCWIGSGWCSGKGPWIAHDGKMIDSRKLPHLGSAGQGVNRKLPHLGSAGQGVNRKLPHLGSAGQGVNRKLPHLGNAGRGVNRTGSVLDQLAAFAERLRTVRVCCGDWLRVCGSEATTTNHGLTGVFLDPPYADTANRASDLYACDSLSVAHDVREWAIERGSDPEMRICLAGYEGEHEMPSDWQKFSWMSVGGMANIGKKGREGTSNHKKERLWFSPHCLPLENTECEHGEYVLTSA